MLTSDLNVSRVLSSFIIKRILLLLFAFDRSWHVEHSVVNPKNLIITSRSETIVQSSCSVLSTPGTARTLSRFVACVSRLLHAAAEILSGVSNVVSTEPNAKLLLAELNQG
jgi:hypothetical protein